MSSQSRRPGVSPRRSLTFALAAWTLGEILVFALVVRAVGFDGALAIGLLTTLAGVILMQRLGRAAARQLRTLARDNGLLHGAGLSDGLLKALAAILLILPGFLSDIVGTALCFGPVRNMARSYVARGRGRRARPNVGARRRKSAVLDLRPEDWRRVDRRD